MKLSTLHEVFLVLSFIIAQIAVKPVASNLSYKNKHFGEIIQDPAKFQLAQTYRKKKSIYSTKYYNNATTTRGSNKINAHIISHQAPPGTGGNNSRNKYKIGHKNDKIKTATSQNKKWQVGRVSRKQYEIINMLWRKTKIFVDVESTTVNNLYRRNNESIRSIRQPFMRLPSRPSLSFTTPSYIEFYYLDETDEHVKELTTQKHLVSTIKEHLVRNHGNHKFVLSDSPMFSFRFYGPNNKRPTSTTRYKQPTNKNKRRKARTRDSPLTGFGSLKSLTPSHKFPRKPTQQNKLVTHSIISSFPNKNSTFNITSTISTTEYTYDNETCPTKEDFVIVNDTSKNENISKTVNVTQKEESTTVYDKIKFFEMYDKHTPVPYYDEKGRLYDHDHIDIFIKGNEINNNERKVLLEHVDQSTKQTQTHKAKHAKKHIIDTYKSESNDQSNPNSLLEPNKIVKPMELNVSNPAASTLMRNITKQNVTKQPMVKLLQSDSKVSRLPEHRKSKLVQFSEYPFAAVYVYEPSQVHCDAAGISPHWLITSGSCLSRHHKNPGGEGRSAFVTYCGVAWWNPERVAYVKYSLVHPRFHPKEKTRRHLYNIGLVQVVNSMASACNGWSSVSLMSHQIFVEGEVAMANAVGWGLDRFDTRYSSNDLPKTLLMSYENKVFSHSCPGNIGYGKAKHLDEEGGIQNVYCLALPPYLGEASDPVHGGLLLVGGKLVALYLQEERRAWGDQCAQYTGTWRLVPWILDVARENDVDTFTLDI